MSIEEIIKKSLEEDIGYKDVTTANLKLKHTDVTADFIAKDDGIIAGIYIAKRVLYCVDPDVKFTIFKEDGSMVKIGDKIASVTGNATSILKAERVALNFLQRLSGIASLTNKFVKEIKGYHSKILDTRKTTPLLRELEKYAVKTGGGYNHRFGLYDMVMLKENHIRSVGSITKAVALIRENDVTHKIEVEVTNIRELKEAVKTKVDRAMLDNMSLEDIKNAVNLFGDKIELEASGNVNLKTVRKIAETGVHYISSGALTHSYKSLDISLLFRS